MSHLSRRRVADQPEAFVTVAEVGSAVRPQPWGLRLAATLELWRERRAMRRALAAMDARSLRDAGISPAAAAFEAGKPFWQPVGPLR